MKILIFLFLVNFAFGGEKESGLLQNQKEKALKEVKEQEKENVNPEDVDCIERADNRSALNRCKMESKNRKRDKK